LAPSFLFLLQKGKKTVIDPAKMTQIMRRSIRERKKPTAIYQVEDKRKDDEVTDVSEPEEEDQMSEKENQQQ
jgi:hypothetical protein